MKLITLSCNQCGAPLEVPEETRFLTCRFCTSLLAVEHSESAVYTRVLEALERQTSELAHDVKAMKLQQELEQLDRSWEAAHPKSAEIVKTASGTKVFAVIALIAALVVWIWLICLTLGSGDISFSILMFGGGVYGICLAYLAFRDAKRFWRDYDEYLRCRQNVLAQLAAHNAAVHTEFQKSSRD
jgi:Flp pilus assembly protein TadB